MAFKNFYKQQKINEKISEYLFKSRSDYARTNDVYEGGQKMIPKFRAWDETNKIMRSNDEIVMWSGQVYINEKKELDSKIKGFSCLPKHLMQSTGLKDKNGVEIFEGDVIGSENMERDNWYVSRHEVVWHDSGFMGKQICSSSYIGLDYWTRGESGYVVIGNIYENPELLEAE